jgi:hypothetical protein
MKAPNPIRPLIDFLHEAVLAGTWVACAALTLATGLWVFFAVLPK